LEKIKQALERARAERLNQADGPARTNNEPGKEAPDAASSTNSRAFAPRRVNISWPSLHEKRVIGGPESNALSDAYRVLRTQVLYRMKQKQGRTLGITSANPGEGKSLTSVNLAISMAKKGPVVLIDADLRRPSLHSFFDIESGHGLGEYLAKGTDFHKYLFNPGIEQLTILPGGVPVAHSSELLVSHTMLELIEELKRSRPGAMLIFDLPPLLTSDDAFAFAPHLDGVLMVVEEGRTAPAELSRATELLSNGSHLLGTVMNKSLQSLHAHYYYRPPA